MPLQLGDSALDLSQPRVMGILNTTPDSFSDGGQHYRNGRLCLDLVLTRAQQMLNEGADIIDVGGESTRPGAAPVSEAEELERVVPVVEVLVRELGAIVSVDTSTPVVMREAAVAGAGMHNEMRALRGGGALHAGGSTGLWVCLWHMQGQPATMQEGARYRDPVDDVKQFLRERVSACEQAGIARQRLVLDSGFGFGINLNHNLELLRRLPEFAELGCPLLVGLSRKSMLGELFGRVIGRA